MNLMFYANALINTVISIAAIAILSSGGRIRYRGFLLGFFVLGFLAQSAWFGIQILQIAGHISNEITMHFYLRYSWILTVVELAGKVLLLVYVVKLREGGPSGVMRAEDCAS